MAVFEKVTSKDKKELEKFRKKVEDIQLSTPVDLLETRAEKTERIARLKKDFQAFIDYYFPKYATSKLAPFHVKTISMIRKDPHIKLLFACGRGLAKSTIMDLMLPIWLWINDDLKVMLLVGKNEKKARVLISDLQAEFEGNQRLKNDFGDQAGHGDWSEGHFVTKNDCAFFALGMGQSPRGIRHRQYRPDYIVADDLDDPIICKNPARVREYADWICGDLIPCGSIRGNRFIQVNNIFAPLTILTHIRDTREGFKYIRQDATDKQLNPYWQAYTKEYYENLRKQVGPLSFDAEFNNEPMIQGSIFSVDLIRWEDKFPRIDHFDHIVGYWDVAYSDSKQADFNAVKVWGLKGDCFYLIKAFVRQSKMYDAMDWMFYYNKSLPGSIHINWYYESQFWNDALEMVYKEVAKKHGSDISLIRDERKKGNKMDRIISMLPYYQQGRIFYNAKEKSAVDMQIGVAQLLAIEPGYKGHDDAPDADEGAVNILNRYITSNAPFSIGYTFRNTLRY